MGFDWFDKISIKISNLWEIIKKIDCCSQVLFKSIFKDVINLKNNVQNIIESDTDRINL